MPTQSTHGPLSQEKLFNLLGLCLLALLWFYAMAWALSGNVLYRDQHFGAALVYYNEGIDLLRPVIPGFNATGAGTPQEFPFWQAAGALALKATGGWWPSVTIVTLAIFTVCCSAWWRLGASLPEIRSGGLLLALLLCQPLVFHQAGLASADGFSLVVMLVFIWQAERLRRSPSVANVIFCVLITTVLAVTKLPFLLAGAFAACWMLFWSKAALRSWVLLGACGFVAVVVFFFWNRWCEQEILRAEFRYRPMMLKEIPHWFFGTLSMRLDPAVYIKGGWRALNCLWGAFPLVGLTLYGIWRAPRSLGVGLLVGALLTTMVFFNLVLVHHHYYLMFAPAVALINATALADLYRRLDLTGLVQRTAFCAGLLILLGLSLGQGLLGINVVLAADKHPGLVGKAIAEHLPPGDKIVLVGGGWGRPYVESGRTYLSVDNTKLVTNPETLSRLRELGYTQIGFIGESELLHSLQITNPGQTSKKRTMPGDLICEETENLPTVFNSEQIIIKELPTSR
jgi:hypothetical protein